MSTTRARQLRNNLTEAERALWRQLRLRQFGGHKFRRQQPLGSYIVDFVCLEKRLIVEVDGGQHAEQVKYDAQRGVWLESQGFYILRFWNYEIFENIDGVKEAIMETLNSLAPLLSPPPQGGRK